jgi:signal peptidase I
VVTLATTSEVALEIDVGGAAVVDGPGVDPWAGLDSLTCFRGGAGRRDEIGRSGKAPASGARRAPAVAAGRDAGKRRPESEEAARRGAGDGRRTRRRGRRAVTRAVLAVSAVLTLALTLAIALPVLFGCRTLVVMSGSMEPTISTGSVVVVKRIPAAEVAVGDVISFQSPETAGRILTHRVQAVGLVDGRVEVETRGDANSGSESWSIDPGGSVGRLVYHIPFAGYVLAPLQRTPARLLLVVVPVLLLGASLLRDIWRSPAGARKRPAGRVPRQVRSGA